MFYIKTALLLTLLVIIKMINAKEQLDPCFGQCRNGSLCVLGPSKYSPAAVIYTENSIDDYHCQCPYGWTGVTCDIPYESCSDDSHHRCHNGGKCIPGLIDKYGHEQLFCDCSGAFDDNNNRYVGKFCEHRAIDYCDEESHNGNFCLHGGICNDDYLIGGPPCKCSEGYEGSHCEFKIGSVPECDLGCVNGGHCVLGKTFLNHDSSSIEYHFWNKQKNDIDPHKYCVCPPNFDGPLCEIKKDKCGDNHCFHGSTCIHTPLGEYCDCNKANTDSASSYAGRYCQYEATSYCSNDPHTNKQFSFCTNGGICRKGIYKGCDCPEGFDGFSCEFRLKEDAVDTKAGSNYSTMTSFGNNNAVYTNNVATSRQYNRSKTNIRSDNGLDLNLAETPAINIVNTNPQNNYGSYDISIESRDFTKASTFAPSKQIMDDPKYALCSLRCMNNGTCRKGVKDYGNISTIIVPDVDHNYYNSTHTEEFEHCVCPFGFTGLQCEIEVETCGDNEHYCLHGSKCKLKRNNNDGGGEDEDNNAAFVSHWCDCSTTTKTAIFDKATPATYAGNSCEHRTSSICTKGDRSGGLLTPLSFCLNGGICMKEVKVEEDHAGCICQPGWYGPHCELKEKNSTSFIKNDIHLNHKQSATKKSGFGNIALVLPVGSFIILACFLITIIQRRRQVKNNIVENINQNRRKHGRRHQIMEQGRHSSGKVHSFESEEENDEFALYWSSDYDITDPIPNRSFSHIPPDSLYYFDAVSNDPSPSEREDQLYNGSYLLDHDDHNNRRQQLYQIEII